MRRDVECFLPTAARVTDVGRGRLLDQWYVFPFIDGHLLRSDPDDLNVTRRTSTTYSK
jgi:hypothetical protein